MSVHRGRRHFLSGSRLAVATAVSVWLIACTSLGLGVPAASTSASPPARDPAALAGTSQHANHEERPLIRRITPILFVDAIEPVLPFWERLGFSHEVEVSHGDRLGFVILTRDESEIMLQTRASLEDDLPSLAGMSGRSVLFVEVEDLDEVIDLLGEAEFVVPRRTTEYGADEIFVREPGGHVIGFAEFGSED